MTPEDHREAVRAVVHGMRTRLTENGFERHAGLLDSLDPDAVPAAPPGPTRLPVLDHFDDAVAAADRAPTADLATALRDMGHGATWTRTAAYVRDPPNATFLDRYAHTTLAVRPDGPDAAEGAGVSLGLLLLGPDVHYPPHRHPADEIYLPVTVAGWAHGDDAPGDECYRPEAAGALLHHRPWQPHGMRTTHGPLLAIYLWTGEVRTPSRFC